MILWFPVNQQHFQVIVICWAATNACHLAYGMHLDHRKTFSFDPPQNHCQEIHYSTKPSATRSVTGRLVARDEDRNKDTIPMPTFARRPSTMSSTTPVEIPRNSMVGQQRQQISELQFDKFPSPHSFLCWKIRFKNNH